MNKLTVQNLKETSGLDYTITTTDNCSDGYTIVDLKDTNCFYECENSYIRADDRFNLYLAECLVKGRIEYKCTKECPYFKEKKNDNK